MQSTSTTLARASLPLFLFAAACGDDGGGNDSDTTTTDTSTATSASSSSASGPTSTTATGTDSQNGTAGTTTAGCEDAGVDGVVVRVGSGSPVAGARVTVFTPGFDAFFEVRTDATGGYSVGGLLAGTYRVGASALGLGYVETEVGVDGECVSADLELDIETEPGSWEVIGDTMPEFFAGTPSGTLMPDGRMMFCHDTQDAVIIDPADGSKEYASMSPSSQGCHMQTALSDGRLIFVGGQDPEDPGSFTNGIPYVKTYDPQTGTWTQLDDLNEPRWYPTLFRLADETLVACGGGQPPDASRTDTCERFDLEAETWTPTGTMLNPTEYSPAALLLTGEVLATWSPPQLYDPLMEQWSPTGDFVQPDRLWPGHADHTLVLLHDGDAIAIGVGSNAGQAMVERYDPQSGSWSLGASPAVVRSQPEVVPLPDGRILAAGGFWQGGDDVPFDPGWPALPTTDLYDPQTDTWRNVADMLRPREYHALSLLAPDGRVITTSGTSNQAVGPTNNNDVEAYAPPYLFRGPRPRIDSVSTTDLENGSSVDIQFSLTAAPTSIVLMGTGATTHWVDAGVPRRIELSFRQTRADSLTADIPTDPVAAPAGWYMLFVLVDDIPSEAQIVRIPR